MNSNIGQLYYTYPLEKFVINTYLANISLVMNINRLSVNRKLIKEHYINIYNEQKNNFIKKKQVYFSGVITICRYNNELFVIDGQHRIKAMQKLYQKYNHKIDHIKFRMDLINVNTYEDMIIILKKINTIVQLDIESLKIKAKNDIRNFFLQKFSFQKRNILSPSNKPRRPYICENKLLLEISNHDKLINLERNILFDLILQINDEYKNYKDLRFGNNNITIKMKNDAQLFNCYLGFDTKFTWINKILKIVESDIKKYGLIE